MATFDVASLSQESDYIHTSPKEADDEDCKSLVKLTMTYIKRYCGTNYKESHFTKFLKDNEIVTSHSKAISQLESFLALYFPRSNLRKTFVPLKNKRYVPYPRSPLGHRTIVSKYEDINSSYSEEDISSTPPSTPPSSQLKRGMQIHKPGSLMEIDSDIAQSISLAPVAPAVNVNVNIFNGHSAIAPPKVGNLVKQEYKEEELEFNQLMRIKVFLPDDCAVDLKISSNSTVSDLRFQVQKQMLARYPAKTEDDIRLERIHIKTRGGWPLNLADRLSAVIHETTVIQSSYKDY